METGRVQVAGAQVAWRAWGQREAPAVLLIHGGAANQHWWQAVIARLDPARRIVTLDLSGHGDSGHRDAYTPSLWAREVDAVIRAASRGSAAVVAHSMGGRIALSAVPALGARFERLVLIDVPIALTLDAGLERSLRKPRRVYASAQEAVQAFRPVPGEVSRPDIARQVAAASVAQRREGGWIYRGDPEVVGRIPNELVFEGLAALQCPVGIVRGARSPYLRELCLDRFPTQKHQHLPVIVVDDAGHHVPLDAPERLAEAIELLIQPIDRLTGRRADENIEAAAGDEQPALDHG